MIVARPDEAAAQLEGAGCTVVMSPVALAAGC